MVATSAVYLPSRKVFQALGDCGGRLVLPAQAALASGCKIRRRRGCCARQQVWHLDQHQQLPRGAFCQQLQLGCHALLTLHSQAEHVSMQSVGRYLWHAPCAAQGTSISDTILCGQ